MVIRNDYFKEELRDIWETEKHFKTPKQFSEDHGISLSYFYENITKHKHKKKRESEEPDLPRRVLSEEEKAELLRLYKSGRDFEEIARLTNINEWDVMIALEPEWENKQIEKNLNSRENIYGMSIVDMFKAGISNQRIAEYFSVPMYKIRDIRTKKRWKR